MSPAIVSTVKPENLTLSEIEFHKQRIDSMTRYELCELWRFAGPGHPYFCGGTELCDYFQKRFRGSGGFSPEISKALGW